MQACLEECCSTTYTCSTVCVCECRGPAGGSSAARCCRCRQARAEEPGCKPDERPRVPETTSTGTGRVWWPCLVQCAGAQDMHAAKCILHMQALGVNLLPKLPAMLLTSGGGGGCNCLIACPCVFCCPQAWQFRQLEFLTRIVKRVEGLEARVDHSSGLSTAPATSDLCTDKLEGLAVGLDEGMAMLGSVVATCSRLTDALNALPHDVTK